MPLHSLRYHLYKKDSQMSSCWIFLLQSKTMSWFNRTIFHGCLFTLGYEVFITSFLTQGRPTIIIFPDEESNLVQILVFDFTFYSCTDLNCVHVFPCFCYHILSMKTKQKEQDFDLKDRCGKYLLQVRFRPIPPSSTKSLRNMEVQG